MSTGNTDLLIQRLAADLAPVLPLALPRRIATGLLIGGLVSLTGVGAILGFRTDLAKAIGSFPFWMKLAYTLSIALLSARGVVLLARPGAPASRTVGLTGIPVLMLAGLCAVDLALTPATEWSRLWLGSSVRTCSLTVVVLAIPIFLALLWSFQTLAPTRLSAAGAAAGIASASFAAVIYCLHCTETSALFVLTWYSLAIVVFGAGGWVLGSRLLRW